MLEAQDVVDLGAAPAVDRLVIVADAADVPGSDFEGAYLGRSLRKGRCLRPGSVSASAALR